jgi:NAD(P)H-flavin reductase
MIKLSSSKTTYNKESDIVKIVITTANTLVKPKPGQYYYIYRPLSYKGWENHPFTLGSFARPYVSEDVSVSALSSVDKQIMVSAPSSHPSWSDTNEEEKSRCSSDQLTFWIRPFDGWTSRLRSKCQNSQDGILNQRLLIEGPYGHTVNLHDYESILFIAGGTGISAALPYIEEHISRRSTNQGVRTREIKFLWTSRNPGFIHDVCAKELLPALTHEDIHCQFYSTSQIHSKSKTAEIDKISSKLELQVNQGRPDIASSIMESALDKINGGSRAGRLAILVCGPASMADEARAAVISARSAGCTAIEYVEETFGW